MLIIFQNSFDEMFLQNRTFGISKLRFLPKTNGVRPILNLRSKVKHGFSGGVMAESVNRNLQDLLHVLNYEKVLVI